MLIFVCNEISGNKVRKETKEFRNIQENIEQKKENPMFTGKEPAAYRKKIQVI